MSNATSPVSLAALLGTLPALAKAATATPAPPDAMPVSLPPAVADRCRVERDGERLVLLTETSAVAQILRFHGPRLAKETGAAGFVVRIQPLGTVPPRASSLPVPILPPEAAEILRNAAQDCDHAPLARALERLAALAQESQK